MRSSALIASALRSGATAASPDVCGPTVSTVPVVGAAASVEPSADVEFCVGAAFCSVRDLPQEMSISAAAIGETNRVARGLIDMATLDVQTSCLRNSGSEMTGKARDLQMP